jgi:cell division protein FtsQ
MNGVRVMHWAAAALAGAAVALLLGAAALWVAQRPVFDFERIEVQGDLRHVSRASVRAALAGRLRGNYFTLSLDEARSAFESVPWVAAASVRRVWPDRLRVTLTEHRALGVWNDGRLLSEAGVLFTANPAEAEVYGVLVDFTGPARFAPQAAGRYREFAGALASLSLEVAAVQVSERASWSLRTTEAQVFELGRDEPVGRVSERLRRVAASYPLVVAQLNAAPTRIDARYSNGFAASGSVTEGRRGNR